MPPKGSAGKAVRNVKKIVEKVDHRNKMFKHVQAGMASAAPPLGTQLGEVGINVAAFVKDFNLKTSIMKPGVKIPCFVTVNADRSYNLSMAAPPFSYFIFQAAGITRGRMAGDLETIAGYITRKHVYEIAMIKSRDEYWQEFDIQDICEVCIDYAECAGVKVVDKIDPDEYAKFLKDRAEAVKRELAEIQAAKEAKLLRG